MMYIPGFSNYLEASVPEYGPEPIMDAEPVVPQRAAVEPMTQVPAPAEVAAPYTLSGLSPEALAGLYALSANNAGGSTPSGIAGLPSLGAGYVPQFEEKLITAPVSNKGNATAYSGMDNQFYMSPNDFVRLVDYGTNTVLFEGSGYEAAQKAVEMGQNLTDTLGRKANYQIQTGKTQDSYVPVANEKFNKTTAGNIANALGTIAPLAMAFVPGLGLTTLGNIAAGAGIGAAGAGLKGDNILKGAAMGGLSAAGGQILGPALEAGGGLGTALAPRLATAVGTGLGSTAGGLVTGQNLKDALIGGVVSGGVSYLAPDITKELGIGQGTNTGSTGGGAVDPNVMTTVTGYTTPSISAPFSGPPSGTQQPAPPKVQDPYDGLNVIGDKFGNLSGVDVGNVFGAPNEPVSAFDQMFRAEQPVAETVAQEEPPAATVTGRETTLAPAATIPSGSGLSPEVVKEVVQPTEPVSPEEILVRAREPFTTSNIDLGGFTTPTEQYITDAVNDDVTDPRTGNSYRSGYDGDLINVTGSVPGAVTGGLNLGGSTTEPVVNPSDQIVVSGERPGAVTGGLDLGALTAEPVVNNTDQIIVSGERPGAVTGGLTLAQNPVVNGVDTVTGEIVATGNKLQQPTTAVPITGDGFTLEPEVLSDLDKKAAEEAEAKKKKLGVEEYLRIAGLLSGIVGNAGGGGGQGQAGTYTSGGRGLNPIFSAKLPSAGGLGTIGANRTVRPMGDVDWLTYGTRPELNFYDYAARSNPAPITTPIPNNPASPIMEERDPMAMAKGGRTEFAVNGAGTGRSDDIPAVLSDGEYVIDAETVALLGDGSSKAGAKKLDELRVKVRKHKGQKLAKGRFSANAKRPEAYLSGGRI